MRAMMQTPRGAGLGWCRPKATPPRRNLAESSAFMDDVKRILVFSDAGGTGRSYHAALSAWNRRLRVHYLLEPGWKADAAIQGRPDQPGAAAAVPPHRDPT
ncbi:hypothetical protein ABIF73_009866 [Bradyrhizobium japonicum]|jgi:hypothetical protein